MTSEHFGVAVIGGGPAGLAAALAAHKEGASVLLIERENRLGGILKQCVHDGFGLVRFKEKLSGPEYAQRFIDEVSAQGIEASLLTFVTSVEKKADGFHLTLVGRQGMRAVLADSLVLSTGCRERTAKQVGIHGTRPAGVLTAGSAQYYTNILGQLPAKRCVVLGSGDIGLIMARRLTLEGAKVLGVYEAKPTPSGLTRNLYQCLADFDIPLYTSHTVTRVFGAERLEAVEISAVDEHMTPIKGTEEILECDGLILSVGLIPENELAETLSIPMDARTKGPLCDQFGMTALDGAYACGNALHVNDLVDYVSESGETAGTRAAKAIAESGGEKRVLMPLSADASLLYLVPQRLDLAHLEEKTTLYFRTREERGKTRLRVLHNGEELYTHVYGQLRPPEMERLSLSLKDAGLTENSELRFVLEEAEA